MKTPIACRHCGLTMLDATLRRGFDAFTGVERAPTLMKACEMVPSPEMYNTGPHDVWILRRNFLGLRRWVEY